MSWIRPSQNFFIYTSKNLASDGNIAGFDLDGTLVRPIRSQFPKTIDDIALLPNRRKILEELINKKFTLVIFTNQKIGIDLAFGRVNTFIQLINLPMIVMMATGNDNYRKPQTGMWEALNKMIPQIKIQNSFYCGDAGGQPQDFADSDLKFAQNNQLQYRRPEMMFPSMMSIRTGQEESIETFISSLKEKTMIVFVGMPGTGKTSFYSKNLQPRGFIHINQDILKTKAKVLKTIKTTCQQGLSMVIDATNPQQEKRQEYYNLAQQYSYTVIVLYFVGDGHGWNKLRTKVVPTIAYSMYYKNLVEPSLNNTPGEVYQLI